MVNPRERIMELSWKRSLDEAVNDNPSKPQRGALYSEIIEIERTKSMADPSSIIPFPLPLYVWPLGNCA